jgi:hypothetical protein
MFICFARFYSELAISKTSNFCRCGVLAELTGSTARWLTAFKRWKREKHSVKRNSTTNPINGQFLAFETIVKERKTRILRLTTVEKRVERYSASRLLDLENQGPKAYFTVPVTNQFVLPLAKNSPESVPIV